jgi:cold shock CspA family protein
MTGRVIQFFDRGFGFIVTEDRATYFLHIKHVVNNVWPKKGDVVTFEVGPTERPGKGPQAMNAVITVPEKEQAKAAL